MEIHHFSMRIEPYRYSHREHDDRLVNAKILTMSVEANGVKISDRELLDGQLPFETELDFYARRAVRCLTEMLRSRYVEACEANPGPEQQT